MENFRKLKFIKEFTQKFPFRQGRKENEAGKFLIRILKQNEIDFQIFNFSTFLPQFEKFYLKVDNRKILAEPCSFKGGYLQDKSYLISSLISSQKFINTPNINFNPKCRTISLSNFYFAPSFAIYPQEINKVIKAKKIKGYIKVKKIKFKSFHILVGDISKPKSLIFAHYDSIKTGAIDNASGVSVILDLIFNYRQLLKNNLFILSANEELSYDYPVYWGKGFRVFENKFSNLFNQAQKIIVIDCVGHSKSKIIKDLEIIKLGFPIKNLEAFKNKIILIAGNLDKLMEVYHSEIDNYKNISEKYLAQAVSLFLSNI